MVKNSRLKNKKAFGDVVSTLILFIAVIGISTGLVIAMKNYAFNTQSSMDFQNKVLNDKLRTSIEIINVVYDDSNNRLLIFTKNLGQTNLRTDAFSIFINGELVIDYDSFEPEDILTNLEILLPSRTGVFSRNYTSLPSGSYEIKLVSEFGGSGSTYYFNY